MTRILSPSHRQLLAAAGVSSGFAVDMDIPSSERIDIGETIAAELADVGVQVKINPSETAVYNDRWVKKQLSPPYLNRWNTFSDPALLDNLAGCNARVQ